MDEKTSKYIYANKFSLTVGEADSYIVLQCIEPVLGEQNTITDTRVLDEVKVHISTLALRKLVKDWQNLFETIDHGAEAEVNSLNEK